MQSNLKFDSPQNILKLNTATPRKQRGELQREEEKRQKIIVNPFTFEIRSDNN